MSECSSKEICECGAKLRRLYTTGGNHTWKPGWWENIANKPLYITSKKQLLEECKKNGGIPTGYA
jgi:hypothetical protein